MSFEELLKDDEFLMRIADIESFEEMQAAFAEAGCTLTEDELIALMKRVPSEDCELGEEDLSDVSGGSVLDAVKRFIERLKGRGFSGGGGHRF